MTGCDAGLLELLGISEDQFVGQNYARLDEVCIAALGPLAKYDLISQTADRLDATAVYGSTEFRIVMLALRDESGRSGSGRILVAVVAGRQP